MNREKKSYFIALTGAKKNVGDFLITDRAIALLKHISQEYEFILYPHWKEFEDLEFVNNSNGIIILGGPGFQMDMFPGVYKLTRNIDDIKVPIYTLGCGWYGKPGDKTTEKLYRFTETSKELLSRINGSLAGISCRDYQTLRTLENNGFANIKMTGCPVWYDIASLGREFNTPNELNKIVYTPAQDCMYSEQSIEIMNFLSKKFKESQIIVSFHRGIGEIDEYTNEADAINTRKLADHANSLGFKVEDVSFNSDRLKFYDDCDLHIGYRVHAHIYFLSKKLPSILIHEDGRGNGVTESLQSLGIDAYKTSSFYSKLFSIFNTNAFLLRVYNKLGLKLNSKVIDELDNILNEIKNNDYESCKKTSKFIDEHYKVMEDFIKKMIYGKEAL